MDSGGGSRRLPRTAALRTTAGSTPTLMRTDETMIWNVQPPDMPSSSLFGADTDEDEEIEEDDLPGPSTRRGRGVTGAGRLMTPVGSQEFQTTRTVPTAKRSRGSLPKVASTASAAPRLPTPEASQILSAELPPTALRSRPRVRPRDSLSPPPTSKQRPRDVVAEYDEPLHDGEDTPNPRRKKAARLSDTPTSAARPPSPSPPSSRRQRTSPPSTTASKRSNGHTPAPRPRQRAPPATAPVKSTSQRAETPRTQPSSLTSPPKSCKVETARFRRSLTPVARKALKGVVVGYKDKPVQAEPGEDPLLLLPEFVRRQRRRTVNPISSSSLPSTIKRKKRAKIAQTEPRPTRTLFTRTPRMEDGDLAEYGNVYGELDPGAGSDSDDGGAANDTFVDVMARRGETRRIPSALGSMPPITADTIPEEDEEVAGSSPFIQPSTTLPAEPTPKRTSPLQGLARFVDRDGDAEEDEVIEREPTPAAARSPTPAEDDHFFYDMAPAFSPPSSPFAGAGSLRGTPFSAAAPSIRGTPALEQPSRSPEVQRAASRTPRPEHQDEDEEDVDPADDTVIVADEDVDEEDTEVPRSPTPVPALLKSTYVSPQRSPTPVQDRKASAHSSPTVPSPAAALATSQGHRTRSSILRESLELAQRHSLTPVQNGSASASHSPVDPSPGSLSSSQRRPKRTSQFMESIEIPTSSASLVLYGRRSSDHGPASPFKRRGISPRGGEEEDAVVPPMSDNAVESDHEEIEEDHVDDHPPSSSTAPSVGQPSTARIAAAFGGEDEEERDWEDDAASIASEAPSVGQPETTPVTAEPVEEDEDEVDWNDAASMASLPPSVGQPEIAPFDAAVDDDGNVDWDDAASYVSLAPSVGQASTAPVRVVSDAEAVVEELEEEESNLPLHDEALEADVEDEDEDPRDTTIRIATLPHDNDDDDDDDDEPMEEQASSPAETRMAEELEDVNPEDDTVILEDAPVFEDAEELEDVDAQDDTVVLEDTPVVDDAEELEDVNPDDDTVIIDNTSFASDSPIASPRSPVPEGISAPSSPPLTPGYFMRLAQARQSASPAPKVAALAPSSPVVTPSSPVLVAASAALALGPSVARALSPAAHALSPVLALRSPTPALRSPTPAQRSPTPARRSPTPTQRSPVARVSSSASDVSADTILDVSADTVDASVLDVSVDTVTDVSALDTSADTVIADISHDKAVSSAPSSPSPLAAPLSSDVVDTSTDCAAPADTSNLDVSTDTLPADLSRTSAPMISSDSDLDIAAESEDEDSSQHSDIDASADTVDVSTDSLAKDLSTLDVSTATVSVHEEEDEDEDEEEAAAVPVTNTMSDPIEATAEAPVATTAKDPSPGLDQTEDGARNDSHWSPSSQPRFDLADIVQAALGAGMVIDDDELSAGFGEATTGLDLTGPVPSGDVAGGEDNNDESREPSPAAEETIPLGHRRRMFAGSTPVRSRLSSSFSQASSSPARSVRSFRESLRLSLAAASSPTRPARGPSAAAPSSDEAAPQAASSSPAARLPVSQATPLETPWRSLLNAPDSSDEEEEDEEDEEEGVPVPAGVIRPPTPPRPHRDVTPSPPAAVNPVEETAPVREQTPAAEHVPAREHTPDAAHASPLPPAFSSGSPPSPTSAHSPRRTAALASPRMSTMRVNVRRNSTPASDPTSPSPAPLSTPHRTPHVGYHQRATPARPMAVAVASPITATPGPAAQQHLLRDPESPFVVAGKAAVPSSPLVAREVTPVREATPVREVTPVREATPHEVIPVRESTPREATPVREATPREAAPVRKPTPREVTPVRDATPPGQATPQHHPTPRKATPRPTPLRALTPREATPILSPAPPTPPQPPSPIRRPPLAAVDNGDEDERAVVSETVRGRAVTPPWEELTSVREATPVQAPPRVEEPVEGTVREATPAREETPKRLATPVREATPAPTTTEPTRHATPPATASNLSAPNSASPRRSPRLSKAALPASPASPALSVTSPRRSPRLSKTPAGAVRAGTPLREVTPAAPSISPSAAVLPSPVASLAPAVPAFYRGSRSPTPSPLGEAGPAWVLSSPARPVSLMASPVAPIPVPSPQKITVFPLHTNTTFNNVAVADRLAAAAAAAAAPSPAKTRRPSMALNIPIVVSVSNEEDQLGDATMDGDSSLWDISASDMTFDADEPGPHHFAEHEVVGDTHWDATRIEAGTWSRSVTPAVERSTPSLQTDEDSAEPEPEEVEHTVRRNAAVLQAFPSVTTLTAEPSSDHHDGGASESGDEEDEQRDEADDDQDDARDEDADAGSSSDAESENGDDEQQQSEGEREEEEDEDEDEDEEEDEDEGNDDDVVEEYDVPLNDNRIVLRIVPRGIVKVEPGEEDAEEAEEVHAPPVASSSAAPAARRRASPAAPVPAPRATSPSRRVFPLPPPPPPPPPSAHTATKARLAAPHASQTTSVQRNVFRYAEAAGTGGVNNLERVLSRRCDRSKSRDRQEPAAGSSRRRPEVSPPRRLHEELAAATDNSFGPDDNINSDDSFRSVVEVSSMDPRAAARAAAILKMHHAYIETGVLPGGTPAPIGRSTSAISRPSSRRGSVSQFSTPGRADRSRFFETEEDARTLTKEELLYEAELEIANATSRRERSVSRLPHDESPPHVPGAWATGSSTTKRKRSADQQPLDSGVDAGDTSLENEDAAPVTERPWTVSNWRHLEKAYRVEQQKFNAERAVVALPTWSPWPLSRPAVPTEWDNNRVIDAFIAKEGVKESEMVGEWTRDVLNMRVEALSRRVARVQAKSRVNELAAGEPATKRPRGTMAEVEPPSTMKRMMNWVFGTGAKPPTALRQSTTAGAGADARRRRRHKLPTPAVFTAAADSAVTSGASDTTAGFLQRVDETFDIGDVTMAPTPLRPVSMPAVLERRRERQVVPPIRERERDHEREAAPVAIPPLTSAYPRAASTEYRYTQADAPSLYAPLYPSLPDRSAAIAPIVSGTPRPRVRVRSGPNGELVDVPTPAPPRRSGEGRGVRDIVRSLEDSGKLELSFESARRARERGQVGELRRVRSLVEQVEEGSFSL